MKSHRFSQTVLARRIQWVLATASLIAAPGLAAAQSASASAQEDEMTDETRELVCPRNYVEIGAMGVIGSSPKFGEYNGLDDNGGYVLGGFNVSGGDGYCQRGGNLRWQVYGNDLGTTSRSLGARVGQQGAWSLNVDFDQLRHYTATGYRSPFLGSAGDNVFTLPPAFGTYFTNQPQPQAQLTPAQEALVRPKDVYNERQNITLGASYALNDAWGIRVDWKHLNMTGGKLIGGYSDQFGDPSRTGVPGGGAGTTLFGAGLALLLNPNKSTTDTFSLAANWTSEKAYASLEYFLSVYRDDYSGFSWSNGYYGATGAAGGPLPLPSNFGGVDLNGRYPTSTLSTPPDNQFHQLKATGGYIFSRDTKLVGGFSFGINKQNQNYAGSYSTEALRANLAQAVGVTSPGSLDGEVQVWHADARLTHKFSPKLNGSVGFKFNERLNKTPSYAFTYLRVYDQQSGPPSTNVATSNTVINIPMSNRRFTADANLNYRIDKDQRVGVGYEYDRIQRWCENAPFNSPVARFMTSLGDYNGVGCASSDGSYENRLKFDYKLAMLDSVSLRAGYTYGDRKADFTHLYYNPLQLAAFTGGTGAIDNVGYRPFYNTSRRQHLLKASVNWDVSSRISLGLDGRYTKDSYYDSELGMTDGNSSSLTFDAQFTPNGSLTYGAYATYLRNESKLKLGTTRNLTDANGLAVPDRVNPPLAVWGNKLADSDVAIGLFGKQTLMGGRLQLLEDLSYNYGKSNYNATYISGPTTGGGSISTANLGSPGDITSKLIQFRLSGSYDLDRQSTIYAGFLYQRFVSNDYFYNAFGNNGYAVPTFMPSYMTEPTYTIKMIYAGYRYSFR
jgi:MtrB/PioB family decaheme-associated outer membrane protein